jgi:hypothetical protein
VSLVPLKALAGRTLRIAPQLEVIPLTALSGDEQRLVLRNGATPRGHWLVRSTGSRVSTLKVVGARTAELLRAFRRPARLNDKPKWHSAAAIEEVIARFVLDGLLEIDGPNGFASAAAAHRSICPPGAERRAMRAGPLAVQALQYAQSLDSTSARDLAQRLYDFNRLPETASWRSRLSGPGAVRGFLGVSGSGDVARLLRLHWLAPHTWRRGAPWLMWRARSPLPASDGYKVYVSPALAALPDAFAVTVRTLAIIGAPEFKVGRDLWGLLRPDKLVIYFSSQRELRHGLRALRSALHGFPPHGVPFAAAADNGGVLFWGIDPPSDSSVTAVRGTESWRRWIAVQLAVYLSAAKTSPNSTVEPWIFALDRLALDGVDVHRWMLDAAEATP